ncbi:hypothetical protein AAU57_05605 [Nonlabens sp. YIK11]|uniref:hypothetical protein n=1 Tax=Nonlabens sp. YIK11 TaxID=1453349 RepID=UPI0006DCA876|nr:hypothetical protein [Nonlabens sp. YIK11]KQC32846.1 hypothetical protein AAU57_05605 [Nonlabens sp. YIK11]
MKKIAAMLMVFAFAKANSLQAQHIILNDFKMPFKPVEVSWEHYDVKAPVKQIEIAVYERDKEEKVVPLEFKGYVFNDNGTIKQYVDQNQFIQKGVEYNYKNGKLVGEMSGSNYGANKIDYIVNNDGQIKSIGTAHFMYENGRLSQTYYPQQSDKKDYYRYYGPVTTIESTPSSDYFVFYKDQILFKNKDDSPYVEAYLYPFDGTSKFFDLDKAGSNVRKLKDLAVSDVAAYNKFISSQLTESDRKAPLSVSKTNKKGDWTAAIYKPQHDPSVHKYYFRKITYADGTVSGDVVVDEAFIKQNSKQRQ